MAKQSRKQNKRMAKLSKAQRFVLNKLLHQDGVSRKYRRELVAAYLGTFEGKRARLAKIDGRDVAMTNRAVHQVRNVRGDLHSRSGRDDNAIAALLDSAKRKINRKHDLFRDHTPAFPPKLMRYFGVEIECFVPVEYASEGDRECPDCDGSGERHYDCDECDGRGHHDCDDCDGTGKIDCEHCDGKGTVDCPDCHGHGCDECNNTGTVLCSECDGKGKEDCGNCDGTGQHECARCEGNGYYYDECGTCEGTGRVDSDNDGFDRLAEHLRDFGVTYAHIHHDSSLNIDDYDYAPVEISILVKQSDFQNLENLCKALNDIGAQVNSTCGLHVHLDFRHVDDIEDVDGAAMRLIGAMNVLRYAVARSRLSNTFCKPGYDSSDKYREVNLSCWERTGTIEIRLHSGTTDFKKISNWMRVLGSIAYLETPEDTIMRTVDDLEATYFLHPDLVAYLKNRIAHFHGEEHRTIGATAKKQVKIQIEGSEELNAEVA